MPWLLFALIAPVLWSVSNHIDKYLYERFYRKSLPGSLMLLTAIVSAFIAVTIAVVKPGVFTLPARSVVVLLIAGLLNFVYIFPYIYALLRDEASRVVPLFQIAPIFSYLLGWSILHEQLTTAQLLGGAVVIIAAIAINLDLDAGFRFKKSVFLLMTLAAALFATEGLLFKYGTAGFGFWDGAFYQYAGLALTGLIVAICSKTFRDNFKMIFLANKRVILTVSLLNEAFAIGAFMAYNYAVLIAPLALVALVSNTQPFFVIAFGIIITLYFPKLGKETLTRRHLAQKIACTAVIFGGTYLLLR
jgi:drug/metabolite transporter (DMT)-like permease